MKRALAGIVLILACLSPAPASSDPCPEATIVAPGLRHRVLCRGQATTETTYRLEIGVFERQAEADAVLEDLRTKGFAAVLEASGSDYRLSSAGLPSREAAQQLRQRLQEHGYPVAEKIERVGQDLTNPEGPWRIHVLEADPTTVRVEIVHAYDAVIGLETTADLAVRHGAAAAVNGGYFRMKGLLAGENQGTLQIDGALLSEPDRGRASIGFFEAEGTTRAVFGRLSYRGTLKFGGGSAITLDGINRPQSSSEIILFTPEFHRTTLTHPGGIEIIVEDGRILEVRDGAGSSVIPPSGAVLSVGSARVEEIRPQARTGASVAIDVGIVPLLPDPDREWERAEDIVGAGPLLLWQGKRLAEPEKESISEVFFRARHPRTAAGVREDGTLVFVTVDGRRPNTSVGMSLPELSDLMLELGCVAAINLDGGGSTTMVVDGEIVNTPSGVGPRRNADSILLFPVP